jgi:hypothetical protein
MAYASHLGGKLVYEHRVGVDRTDGQVFPDELPVLSHLLIAISSPEFHADCFGYILAVPASAW